MPTLSATTQIFAGATLDTEEQLRGLGFWGTDGNGSMCHRLPTEVQALGDFLDLVGPFQQLLHRLKTSYLVQTVATGAAAKANCLSFSKMSMHMFVYM
jgi:hypothetical protein